MQLWSFEEHQKKHYQEKSKIRHYIGLDMRGIILP